jgi:hypothetical protein
MDIIMTHAELKFDNKDLGEFAAYQEQINKLQDEQSDGKSLPDISHKYQEFIMSNFKYDHLLSLEDKINLTSSIVFYHTFLTDMDEFFEEECHLALVTWVDKYVPLIKKKKADEKVFQLLYNIIIIFEIIPIKVADLFELKIFQKLNKIRKYIKHNLYIYHHLDKLINYWTGFCTENYVQYGKKRQRNEEEEKNYFNDEEKEENFELPKKKVNYYYIIFINLLKLITLNFQFLLI